MVTDQPTLAKILDHELIGLLTAVDDDGQPQTTPVWFVRDGEDIVVYNKPDTPRLRSIAANPKVALSMRGDRRGHGAVLLEGLATLEPDISPAKDLPGYVDKYAREIDRLGWTPESFSSDYSAGIRITVTRTRAWGLDALVPR